MLVEVFKEFINVIKENQKYTIGLLNKNGFVISCSKEEYIGHYFNIKDSYINDVFYEIIVKNQNYGYMWVNGNDENLSMISNLLLDSLKTRLMYELNTNSLKQKVTKNDTLIKHLLDEENFDSNYVLDLINSLGIDKNKPRLAIYIISDKKFNVEEITNLKLRADSKELIYSLLDNNRLLIFKDIPYNLDNSEIKKYIKKYINSLKDWGFQYCLYLVGSVQNKLDMYIKSYNNCLWLEKNVDYSTDEIFFFMDYLFNYFVSKIKLDDIKDIFDFYNNVSKAIDINEFENIVNRLIVNDYNITQTANDLFLHKNTLIYKIKKYEEIFNIDIRGSFQGKVLLVLISSYLKEYQRQK